jgi:hypothetical protein
MPDRFYLPRVSIPLNRSSKSFINILTQKFRIIMSMNFPPHLKFNGTGVCSYDLPSLEK